MSPRGHLWREVVAAVERHEGTGPAATRARRWRRARRKERRRRRRRLRRLDDEEEEQLRHSLGCGGVQAVDPSAAGGASHKYGVAEACGLWIQRRRVSDGGVAVVLGTCGLATTCDPAPTSSPALAASRHRPPRLSPACWRAPARHRAPFPPSTHAPSPLVLCAPASFLRVRDATAHPPHTGELLHHTG
uniref:Uncharacterized protein n=1 Tax=Oryza sativa subsp. japonica TaxID=39947 RepID=Q6YTL0_ORYSJ|nr:hypothetical protein [Oryza sativa Japonica Group]